MSHERGSDKLVEHLFNSKVEYTWDDVVAISKLLLEHRGRIVDIWKKGVPRLDQSGGKAHFATDALPGLVRDVIGFQNARLDLNIIINGIPFPDFVEVDFKTRTGLR